MITLVLLPGMDGTGRLFADFIDALGPEFETRVVAYPADASLDYSKLETIARSFLPHDKPFVLLAESFSGPIGISISASKPPGLVGLVLCCSFARSPRPILSLFWPLLQLLPFKLFSTTAISKRLLGRYSTTHLQSQLEQTLALVSLDTIRTRIAEVAKIDVSTELGQICAPILYLRATRDCLVKRRSWENILKNASHAHLAEIEGPHLLLQAKPSEAAGIATQFARNVTAASGLTKGARTSRT